MNFGKFDIQLILIMSTTVIFMSIVFPSLGLAGDSTSTSDVPEFNPEAATFDMAPDYPSGPEGPDEGTLIYKAPTDSIQNPESSAGDHSIWVHRETGGNGNTLRGAQLTWLAWGNSSTNPDMEITLFTVESDGSTTNTYAFDMNENESMDIQENGWLITVEFTDEYIDDNGYYTAELDFEVVERWDQNVGGGGLISGVASALVWFTKVSYWFLGFIFEISVNLILLLFETINFTFSLFAWISTTYFNVANSLSGIGALITLLPGIVMSLELAKLVFIGISLLPTT